MPRGVDGVPIGEVLLVELVHKPLVGTELLRLRGHCGQISRSVRCVIVLSLSLGRWALILEPPGLDLGGREPVSRIRQVSPRGRPQCQEFDCVVLVSRQVTDRVDGERVGR